ncbi:putative NADPH-dependent FMN reductase [Hypoxylon sp. NC1633]|nr:putative NADPH-dependent FMN reductase [Hypoxylon sp. NC1633]
MATEKADHSTASSIENNACFLTKTDLIDLNDFNLPFFDEPGNPKTIKSPEDYTHEHTRLWSRRIAAYDAFIFLSVQRDWGIAVELKNATDFLFHEWSGKPAMIITYGSQGGVYCAEQLEAALGSIGVPIVSKIIKIVFSTREFTYKAFRGENLLLDASDDDGPWAGFGDEIASVFWNELVCKMMVTESAFKT